MHDLRFLGMGKRLLLKWPQPVDLRLLRMDERNPMLTTTFGTGELIMACAENRRNENHPWYRGKCHRRWRDWAGGRLADFRCCWRMVKRLRPGSRWLGAILLRVVLIKHGRGSPVEKIHFEVAADVTNPLCGPTGAVVFGPQKGATPEQIILHCALYEFARRNDKLKEAILPGAVPPADWGLQWRRFSMRPLNAESTSLLRQCALRHLLANG